MWNRALCPGTESDTHSSSSSLQWMMKGPLAATLVAEVEAEKIWDEQDELVDEKVAISEVEEPP